MESKTKRKNKIKHKNRVAATTAHREVAVAADGADGTAADGTAADGAADGGASSAAKTDTYTKANAITETGTQVTRICNVQADNTLTECKLKAEIDAKRGIKAATKAPTAPATADGGAATSTTGDGGAATSTAGDGAAATSTAGDGAAATSTAGDGAAAPTGGDADGARASVLATATMRVEVTITSMTRTSVNAAATQSVQQWSSTTVGGLTVTKNPAVLTLNTNSRAVDVLQADGGAAPPTTTSTADGGAAATTTTADGGAAATTTADGGATTAAAAGGDGAPATPTRWEPKRGVIDGQGCIEDGCTGYRQPYFLWTRLIKGNKNTLGGMVYFEWRGNNGDVLMYLIMCWVILLFLMALIGFLMKNKYQKPLNGPLSPMLEMVDQYLPLQLRFYWGTLMMNLWIIGWCLLCFFYVWNHATINNLVGKTSRGIGGVVAGLLVLQLFPVSRHSVLLWCIGIPFERALAFHRRIGGWIWVLTVCHFIGMFADHMRYYRQGTPVYSTQTYTNPENANEAARLSFERMFRWEIGFPHGPPAAGFISWCALTIVCLGALPYIRRNYWNVFVLSHLMYIVVYVMAWIHYPSLMIYCGIPVILYAVDLMSRHIHAGCVGTATIKEHEPRKGGITKLTISMRSFSFEPTQYVLVKIPSISSLEWHPFSISSRGATEDGMTTFSIHMKANGPDSWTAAVANKDLSGEKIVVQGPFGNSALPRLSKLVGYDKIVMCTGGVGITPALSLLEKAVRRKTTPDGAVQVELVWSGRGADAFECFGPELANCHAKADDSVTLTLHNTADDAAKFVDVMLPDSEDPTYSLPVLSGRPDYAGIFDGCGSKTAVFACGPAPMVRAVEEAAYAKGFDFHAEVFEF